MSAVKKIKNIMGEAAVAALSAKYLNAYEKNKVSENVIFYTSHQGSGMTCSPYAIFDRLMRSEEFDKYLHIWQINDPEERRLLSREYSGCPNVRFVGKNSGEYFDALTSAKYIISNNTFPYYFTKKPEQVYVNTWHGIPLKTLGYDVPDGKFSTRNMTRNFLLCDYIISTCRFTTDIFKKSYKLDGIYSGTMTECGTPRADMTLNSDKGYVISRLAARGTIIDDDKKIILYAPTWKGSSFVRAENDVARYDEFCDYLSHHIDTEKYQILIKPHPMVYKLLTDEEKSSGRYVSQSVDTNELLSITDVLVSDYSSIFFDFLLTDRPILFYIPDIDSYSEYRGMYFGLDTLPGPRSQDMGDIAQWIGSLDKVREEYAEPYQKMKAWACEFDDGKASERVIEAVFRQNLSECRAVTDIESQKRKILVAGGTFKSGCHTEKILSWLDSRDYSKEDITLLVDDESGYTDEISRINDSVRVICRCKGIIKPLSKRLLPHGNITRLSGKSLYELIKDNVYAFNYRRYFGDIRFDTLVNFAYDSPEQALLAYNCGQSVIASFEDSPSWISDLEAVQSEWEVKKYE